jgi:hypothetical protein
MIRNNKDQAAAFLHVESSAKSQRIIAVIDRA